MRRLMRRLLSWPLRWLDARIDARIAAAEHRKAERVLARLARRDLQPTASPRAAGLDALTAQAAQDIAAVTDLAAAPKRGDWEV